MKRIHILTAVALMAGLILTGFGRAQDARLPFKGTIRYKIAYESEQIPAEQLAAQPASAVIKLSDTKLLMDTKATKTILNADENRSYTLINLAGMGLGKYVITETAEEMRDTSDMQNYVLTPTDETKSIHGYTAKKAVGSYRTPQAEMTFEVYYVENFCPAFFNLIESSFIGLDGFPLAYTVRMRSVQGVTMSTAFTVEAMTYEEPDTKGFNIPKSYQTISESELQRIVEEFMSAFE